MPELIILQPANNRPTIEEFSSVYVGAAGEQGGPYALPSTEEHHGIGQNAQECRTTPDYDVTGFSKRFGDLFQVGTVEPLRLSR
jgi:hypothetical protein